MRRCANGDGGMCVMCEGQFRKMMDLCSSHLSEYAVLLSFILTSVSFFFILGGLFSGNARPS